MDVINYSTSLLHFVGIRKHFLKDIKYNISVFEDFLVMSEKSLDSQPKYIIKYSLKVQIQFIMEPNWKDSIKMIAFAFKYNNQFKEMIADHDNILKMKNIISNKVTFFKIADFYDPQYIIGKGSSARVLLVQKLYEEEKFAVKSIDKSYLSKNENGLDAFAMEVKILTMLSDKNTEKSQLFLKLYEIFEGTLTFYLVVELMAGKTLQEEMDFYKSKGTTMRPESIRLIMKKIFEGVKIMHDNNVIHRDLKPDNIMFAVQGDYQTLRIVDFGLATEATAEKYMFPKCGTPGYAAPEVLNLTNRNQKYSAVCDLFSCGCIFYKLLTGKGLFQGTQFDQVLKLNKLCEIDIKNNYDIQKLSTDSQDLLQQLLQKDPSKRIDVCTALNHPYFQDFISTSSKLIASSFQNTNQQTINSDFLNVHEMILEDEFSPFQKRAINKTTRSPKQQFLEEEHNNQINLTLSERDLYEFYDVSHSIQFIQQLPVFKKNGISTFRHDYKEQKFNESQMLLQSGYIEQTMFQKGNSATNYENVEQQIDRIKVSDVIQLKSMRCSSPMNSLSPVNSQGANGTNLYQAQKSIKYEFFTYDKYNRDSKNNTVLVLIKEVNHKDRLKESKKKTVFMDKLSLFNRFKQNQDPNDQDQLQE